MCNALDSFMKRQEVKSSKFFVLLSYASLWSSRSPLAARSPNLLYSLSKVWRSELSCATALERMDVCNSTSEARKGTGQSVLNGNPHHWAQKPFGSGAISIVLLQVCVQRTQFGTFGQHRINVLAEHILGSCCLPREFTAQIHANMKTSYSAGSEKGKW